MWEALLTVCLAGDPLACETSRLPPERSRASCVARAAEAAEAAAGPGWSVPQSWPCVPAGEDPKIAVSEIAPGVFVHRGRIALASAENGGDIANLGFVVGEEAVAAIDAGSTPEIARGLLAAIRAVTDLPVRWLVLTHMHPDHALGASVFREAGATIIGHDGLAQALGARAEAYAAAAERQIGARIDAAGIPAPDDAVAGTRDIDLGGRVLRLEAHPAAHTGVDLTARDLATDTWFLGDLLFLGHIPTLDGSLLGWIDLLDALAARPAARAVPGHGPVSVAWPEAAGPLRAYLAWLAAAARAAVAEGAPLLEATREIAARTPEGWALGDAFGERNATAAIRELEWE